MREAQLDPSEPKVFDEDWENRAIYVGDEDVYRNPETDELIRIGDYFDLKRYINDKWEKVNTYEQ